MNWPRYDLTPHPSQPAGMRAAPFLNEMMVVRFDGGANQALKTDNLPSSASSALLVIFIIFYITSWALLLRFHRNGRFFYTVAVLSGILLAPLIGDEISYGLFYPIEWLVIALDGLILYLIHFTPLKHEFGREEPKISEV